MLSQRHQLLVVNLYEELHSYRAVAEVVGCDPKTVKAHIARAAEGSVRAAVRRASVADPYVEMIASKVEVTKGRITAKVMLRTLRAAGYEGSSRTLRRAVAKAKAAWKRGEQRVYRPWQSAPGDVLLVDWGHVGVIQTAAGPRPLSVFCAVLGWSRYRFVCFSTSQRFTALAGGLATCFEHLGGVPARVMFDNPKTVTLEFVAGVSVLNPDVVALGKHYPFEPITAAAFDPESKGKVEALVRYVKSDCIPAEGFASLDEANRWAEQWCTEVNGELHPETCAVPADRLVVEREVLRPLRERPTIASGERRCVDKCATIRFASARYSVPSHLRDEWVEVAVDDDRVRVFAAGVEVALHPLLPPGEQSIDPAHYPAEQPTGVRPLRPVTNTEKAFCELGPQAERYLRSAAAAGASRLPRQLDDALALVRSHGAQKVLAAMERAVIFQRFGAEDLRSILAAGAAVPPLYVAASADLVVPVAPVVPIRDLEAYAWPA